MAAAANGGMVISAVGGRASAEWWCSGGGAAGNNGGWRFATSGWLDKFIKHLALLSTMLAILHQSVVDLYFKTLIICVANWKL